MPARRTSRPHAFAPRREGAILARRALRGLLPAGWSVQHESDGTPPFPDELLIRQLRGFSRVARLALDEGLVPGVARSGKSVLMSQEAQRALYEVMATVAWPDRPYPAGAIREAQAEVSAMLAPLGRVPDFAIVPEVRANPFPPPRTVAQRLAEETARKSLAKIEVVVMPRLHSGARVPNERRYRCGLEAWHLHPSRAHALRCHDRWAKAQGAKAR